jgi:hypothetical protein
LVTCWRAPTKQKTSQAKSPTAVGPLFTWTLLQQM